MEETKPLLLLLCSSIGNPVVHDESEVIPLLPPGIEVVSAPNRGHYVNIGTSFVARDIKISTPVDKPTYVSSTDGTWSLDVKRTCHWYNEHS